MAHKSSKKLRESRIKTLCLKWEAIRRNEKYSKDFSLAVKLGEVKPYHTPNGVKPSENRGRIIDSIYWMQKDLQDKWEINELLDPSYSFFAKLFPKEDLKEDMKVIEKLFWIFKRNKAVHVLSFTQRPNLNQMNILTNDLDEGGKKSFQEHGKRMFFGKHNAETLAAEKIIHVLVDTTKSKEVILAEIEEAIDFYKKAQQKFKVAPRPETKKRFRVNGSIEIFKTYDLVQKEKKSGKINWRKVAEKRFGDAYKLSRPCDKSKMVRDEYSRAKALIEGGFRHIG